MNQRSISAGTACILVKDNSLYEGENAPLYKWLREEGFISWGYHGACSGVDWVYINLCSKVYAPGMPGIPVTKPICNHAVTLDEFMTIYGIFKKYEGLSVLKMSE